MEPVTEQTKQTKPIKPTKQTKPIKPTKQWCPVCQKSATKVGERGLGDTFIYCGSQSCFWTMF